MKPSVIIALIVGGVVGFAVGNMFKPNGGNVAAPLAAIAPSPSGAKPAGAPPADTSVFKVNVGDSAARGPANALVTLVEFSDYQCPFCSRGNTTVEAIEKEFEGKIRVVMKQHPLDFHPRAKPAALAALSAGEQGKYWEMHHKIFANQQQLEDSNFEGYAKELGLNVDKWKADIQLPKFQTQIDRETAEAMAIGASGTPAFYINGRKLSGAQPIETFRALVNEELGKAETLVKSGTPANEVYAKIMATAQTAPAAPPAAPGAPAPAAVRKIDIPADSPAKGSKTAKVNIVLWSDFQCPFCSRVVPTLKQIHDTYGENVNVVFRHQPLPFHNNAKIAAEASMAANEQGKFWPFHDKMFANQQTLDRPNLENYAKEIGLDMGKFTAALDSGKFTKRVEEDSAAGMAVGANGTPTFFINGREFVGAQPFEAFKTIIDSEIKAADALLAKGVKPAALYAELMKNAAANAPAPAAAGAPEPAKVVTDLNISGAPVKGGKNAKVTIVAFSDFQCPFCSRVVPTLKQIHDTYGEKVKVAFMHQPLPFHNNAKPAAMASMAANEQGKFWEYHDKLFANQQALERSNLDSYAQELGLDMGKYKAAMDSNKFDAQVSAMSAEGMRVGANGTPTFFINGRQIVGAQPFDAFKSIIEEELKK